MQREVKILFFVVVLIALMGVSVYAAGTSEGGSRSNRPTNIPANTTGNDTSDGNQNRTNVTNFDYQTRDCEVLNTTRERIRCRLIQGNESLPDSVPEACRNDTIRGKCVAFYNTVRSCYELEGRAKDQCFKRASGLTKVRLDEENATGRPEKARNYLIALLYNLEEKVERQVELGKLTSDEGAEIIDKIVEIKKAILEGKNKSEIKTMVQELRQMWEEKITEE